MKLISTLFLALSVLAIAAPAPAADKPNDLFQQALVKERTQGNLPEAIKLYQRIVDKYASNHKVAAQALLQLAGCQSKLGDGQARKSLERLVRDFADQKDAVAAARARLKEMGGSGGAGGLVTRRLLADASGVNGILTADGKYISRIDRDTGEVVQFEVASGQTSRIPYKGQPWNADGWSEGAARYLQQQVFSHDGKQIAYESITKDRVPVLRIRNLDGSSLRTLYSGKSNLDSYPVPLDWSSDGASILALRLSNGAKELTLISTADGAVRVLKNTITPEWPLMRRAKLSPDGRFVAFSFIREGGIPHSDVFVMTADGRNEVAIAGHPAEDYVLRWAPDGGSLLFLSDRSGTWDIWTVRIAEGKQQGEPEVLKRDFGYDSELFGFAPDGSLYYTTATASGGLYIGEVDLETGKVLAPPALAATRYAGPAVGPRWSRDGRSLVYLSHPGPIGPGNNILTIRSVATGEERFLSPPLRSMAWPSWAPDGQSILTTGITVKNQSIFRIDAETSATTMLRDQGLAPQLCLDGRTLVFVWDDAVRKRSLDSGEESVVAKTDSERFDLSPDGREVVFQLEGAVKIAPLNGGAPRELFRGLAKTYDLRWTRDGHYITARSGTRIWRLPVQGGTPLKLDVSVPNMVDFVLSPDSRHFAFNLQEGAKSELWVMENFLPAVKTAAKK